MKRKHTLRFLLFSLLATLFVALVFTSADFVTAPAYCVRDYLVLFLQWGVLCLALWPILTFLASYKLLFALSFPPLVLLSSVLTYFRYTTHTVLTSMILDASLDNDLGTSLDLVSFPLVLFMLLSLAVSVAFVWYRYKKLTTVYPVLMVLGSSLFFLALLQLPAVKRPMSERIPFNLYFVTARYWSEKSEILKERQLPPGEITCTQPDSLVVVFVLGESLRADHLGLNGYPRQTTPLLALEEVLSFPNIYTEYTYTNRSLAHILTRADSLQPELAFQEPSFVGLFQHCGFYASWLANQEPAKPYAYFMNECDTLVYANPDKSPYVFDIWTDTDLLPLLDYELSKGFSKHLFILHSIGSHWYYNAHYTPDFKQFTPVTKSRIVSSSTQEEMINSYDNTVLFTDYFLWSVIERLRDKNALLIYLSDHGESLGEDGLWLHATQSPPVHNPACLLWLSAQYKEKHPHLVQQLSKNLERRFRTDFLFHTLSLAAGIEAQYVLEEMSLFKHFE